MNPFEKFLFKGPKFSLQDLSFDNRLTLPIGKIVPVAYWEVFPNEEFDCSVQQLTRMMPMPAPVMQRFDIFVDAHFVPYRLLKTSSFDSEKFFNLRTNDVQSPDYSLPKLTKALTNRLFVEADPGTLADYLGVPSLLTTVRKKVEAKVDTQFLFPDVSSGDDQSVSLDYFPSISRMMEDKFRFLEDAETTDISYGFWGESSTASITIGSVGFLVPLPFGAFVFEKLVGLANVPTSLEDFADPIWYLSAGRWGLGPGHTTDDPYSMSALYPNDEAEFWSCIKSLYGVSRVDLYEMWIKYVCGLYLDASMSSDLQLNVLPFLAFHRIIGDWYINSNFEDPDTYYLNHVYGYLDSDNFEDNFINLPNRYWAQDYFTSCFDSPQVGNAVMIPVNGTISDLRSANAFQKILERAIYTGKRYIEQVRSFFGAHSSDARFDRTEVLGRKVYRMNINDVTQTNQSDFDSLLSTPVGQVSSNGLSVSGDKLFHYKSEEHGMLMVLMSIRPKAAYYQGLPRIYSKNDVEDFLWPQYAQVGEQPIYVSEIYADQSTVDSSDVFGFNRRYAEYVCHLSEVHGEFRSSMDYWHSGRLFDSRPVLNTEFLKVTEKDQVERIFNYPDNVGNVVSWLYFDVKAARALPRYINYDL